MLEAAGTKFQKKIGKKLEKKFWENYESCFRDYPWGCR